jgi:catechol 2,3-dioxygenase-like lactoylglutathione lyase family enzyme
MIQRPSHTSIYVLDQDAARDFYVNKLGFEVRMDQRMDNGFRWLTVSPKV